jgi:hypothetical protein
MEGEAIEVIKAGIVVDSCYPMLSLINLPKVQRNSIRDNGIRLTMVKGKLL